LGKTKIEGRKESRKVVVSLQKRFSRHTVLVLVQNSESIIEFSLGEGSSDFAAQLSQLEGQKPLG
jgi:hypothetical protein